MIVRLIRGLAAATVLLVAATPAADAQAAAESRFAITGGVDMPMGDFGDVANMGFVVGGQFTRPLGTNLKLRFNVDYAMNGFSDDLVGLVGDGNWTRLGAMANVLVPLGDMGLYGLGGLGFYSLSSDISGSSSSSDLAWNIGAGMGKGKWFVEARYQSIMADPSLTSLPIVFGLRF